MWGSVPVKNFIISAIHLQIGLGNGVLIKLLFFGDYDVEKLYTGEEFTSNTLVTVNQVISKKWQDHQIWDFNDGIMLRRKCIQLKRLHYMK